MHTIKEASKILGISPQAVYKKLKQFNNELKTEIKEVVKQGKPVKVVTDKGLEILKSKADNQSLETDSQQVDNLVVTDLRERIEDLRETIKTLNRQLDTKDKQIQELNERLREQQILTRNSQSLLLGEQQKALPSGTTWEKVKGIFKRNEAED